MINFKGRISIACFAAAMLLAGCGGGSDIGHGQQAAQGVAVGEPAPVAPVAADFIQIAQQEGCSDIKNHLYLIDGKEVFYDRAGNCADNAYSQRLYGATPQALLCEYTQTIAGAKTVCANDAVRALFDQIRQNTGAPRLGLDASHTVQYIPFLPLSGTAIQFQTLVSNLHSGVTEPRNVVVRDQASWQSLWTEHVGQTVPPPGLPSVDFSSQMVIAVFTGNRAMGCGNMGIVHVGAQDGKMVVDYEDRSSPMGRMCPNVITSPVQMVLVDRNDAPVDFVVHQVRLIATTVLDQNSRSGVAVARNVVIKDQAAWAALWLEHAGKDSPVPAVDFSTSMVIGVFLGAHNGCNGINIDSVSTDGTKISVRHTDLGQGGGAMCIYNPSPSELVMLNRSDLPVEFATDNAPLPFPMTW